MSRSRRRLLIVLVLALALAAGLRYLDVHPPDLSGWQGRDPGDPAPRPAPDDVPGRALFVHRPGSGEERPFSENDWSFAWIGTLEQAFGRASFVLPSSLAEPDVLRGARVVVVSPAGAAGIDAEARSRLDAFVRGGGILVLDRPPAALEELARARLAGPPSEARRVTAVSSPDAVTRADLLALPLATVAHRVERRDPEVTVLLEVDGSPAILERLAGDGLVQTIALDLPRALVALQQGTPATDAYRVEKRFGNYDWLLEPEDLVCDERLLDNPVPFADVLEDFLAGRWCAVRPLPRVHRFPMGYDGALLMTHDEDEQGGAATAFLAEHEQAIGATSTFFVVPNGRLWDTWHSPRDWFERFRELGVDIQLHWNLLPMPTGIWKFEPVRIRYPLARQADLLRNEVESVLANRTHYLILGDHYTRSFRALSRQGIRWDSTFGPNRGGRGYLFGTGLPFRPLDTNGFPFPLRELPFVTQEDWGGASPEFLERLFERSRERDHQVIVPIFHPNLIVREPEGEAFWKASYDLARAANHWITDFPRFDAFWRRRSDVRIRSRFREGLLEVVSDAPALALSLLLPERSAGRGLRSVLVDGEEVEPRIVRDAGGSYAAVPLRVGRSRIDAKYAASR